MYKGKFFENFGVIFDRRQEGKIWHDLIDVLFIIVSASFCNIDDVDEIWEWAQIKTNTLWLRNYVALKNGIPSISTIRRILNTINPKQFEKCFISWMSGLTIFSSDCKDTIAIDGKTMKGSRDGDKVTHIVNAWCSANNLVLGQVKTHEKSNEITAIPELLDLLYIEGCTITMDAMGCQKKIVEKIIKKKADYVISLKGNQETLHDEVKTYYDDLNDSGELKKLKEGKSENNKIESLKTVEKGHGRIEIREYTYSTDIDWMINAKKDWVGLNGIDMSNIQIESERLLVRELNMSDISDIDEYASDADVTEFTVWGPNTKEQTKMFVNDVILSQKHDPRKDYDFGIVLKKTEKLIGTGAVIIDDFDNKQASIGYCINKNFWGLGYGRELLKVMQNLSFNILGLHRIYALVDPQNIASIKILEKTGMKNEGLLREHRFQKGKWRSSVIYSMLEKEYLQ